MIEVSFSADAFVQCIGWFSTCQDLFRIPPGTCVDRGRRRYRAAVSVGLGCANAGARHRYTDCLLPRVQHIIERCAGTVLLHMSC
jgi:hypothetical protein